MVINLLLLLVALVILTVGAEGLVRGASRLALRLGISNFVVGLTVVGFGTSAPELAASVASVSSGHPGIALGNVIGSNIMNIALVLGISAMILPIPVSRTVVRRETWVVIATSFLPYLALLSGGTLERWMGILYLVLLGGFFVLVWRTSRSHDTVPEADEVAKLRLKSGIGPVCFEIVLMLVGIVMLVLGADMLVEHASDLARGMGVSELVIGLTIVAFGTSAPELVTSLVATFRGNSDLGVGNVLGSCVFNILGILGITIIVVPIEVPTSTFFFDLPVMIGLALACIPILLTRSSISTTLLYVGWPADQLEDRTDSSIQPPPSTSRPS